MEKVIKIYTDNKGNFYHHTFNNKNNREFLYLMNKKLVSQYVDDINKFIKDNNLKELGKGE